MTAVFLLLNSFYISLCGYILIRTLNSPQFKVFIGY